MALQIFKWTGNPMYLLIALLGFKPDLGPVGTWGLELERNSIKVTPLMETNLPGVYAAGDVVHYLGKLELIATGYGEAAVAVNNAAHFINPKARVNPAEVAERLCSTGRVRRVQLSLGEGARARIFALNTAPAYGRIELEDANSLLRYLYEGTGSLPSGGDCADATPLPSPACATVEAPNWRAAATMCFTMTGREMAETSG